MERLFGDPSWHRIVARPGVWAWRKQEEIVVTDFDMHRLHADQMTEKMAEQAARTDVNVAIGEKKVPAAKLDNMAELVAFYDQLTEAINKAEVQRTEVQGKIKAAMGKSTVATLGGVPIFTYQPKDAWRTADIRKAMPHLVDEYRVTRTVETIDWERLTRLHAAEVEEHRSYEFRRVSGTRATRG